MPFENTKMSAARYEDYKFPPNIICHPNTNYARDVQVQGACTLWFLVKQISLLYNYMLGTCISNTK